MTHTVGAHRLGATSQPHQRRSSHAVLGMWSFLAGDAAMFVILLLGYLVMRWRAVDWPDPSLILDIPLAVGMTTSLIFGSVLFAMGTRAMHQKRRSAVCLSLSLTAVSGILFLTLQYFEWEQLAEAGVLVAQHPYGAAQFSGLFYIITGFHGMHVLFGVLLILVILMGFIRSGQSPRHHDRVRTAGMYWHFVDLVWLFIVWIVYLP